MITYSMTPLEIFRQIYGELDQLNYWMFKKTPNVLKEFDKIYTYPKSANRNFISPRTNNEYWFIYSQNEPKTEIKEKIVLKFIHNHFLYYIIFDILPIFDKEKKDVYYSPILKILTGHFIKRYKERCLNDTSIDDIKSVELFITNNNPSGHLPSKITNKILNTKKTKPNDEIFRINQGFCIVNCKEHIIGNERIINDINTNYVMCHTYKTFLPDSILSNKQIEEIELESVDYIKAVIEMLNNENEKLKKKNSEEYNKNVKNNLKIAAHSGLFFDI
ncbi:MAG: hypothetical protein MJ211_02365 [Bacteroidales bacterium]|nr:hypothetical protein [Bacteroidales bacterium]